MQVETREERGSPTRPLGGLELLEMEGPPFPAFSLRSAWVLAAWRDEGTISR